MKKKTLSAYMMAVLLTAGIASTQATAGILAEGNISIYKDGQLANTITGQNPVDEESLMICNEKCLIKSTGISIVGATGTELAVKGDQEQFNLLLKKGQLDFILSGAVGKMGFYTADRQYASADVIFNARTDKQVRGYMEVTPAGDTKIGVYDGRLIFNTVEGAKTVDSNNYILLAQADIDGSGDLSETSPTADNENWECDSYNIGRLCDKDTSEWYCSDDELGKECDDDIAGVAWSNEVIVATAVVAGATAWGVYEYLDDDDDDDSPVPSSTEEPTPASSSKKSSSSSKSSSRSSSTTPTPTFPRNPSPSI